MKTPLYLAGRYCLSLEELTNLLRRAVEEKGALYEEILTVLVDGILAQWLMEGSDEEKKLVESLSRKEPKKAFNMLCIELGLPTVL